MALENEFVVWVIKLWFWVVSGPERNSFSLGIGSRWDFSILLDST